jgi:hypothetical protein
MAKNIQEKFQNIVISVGHQFPYKFESSPFFRLTVKGNLRFIEFHFLDLFAFILLPFVTLIKKQKKYGPNIAECAEIAKFNLRNITIFS